MQHFWSALFRTELLLLLFIAQLFWPLESLLDIHILVIGLKSFFAGASWVTALFLPGWRWSYIFFPGKEIGLLERSIISICISVALFLFSILYLHLAKVNVTVGMQLIVVSFWIFAGSIGVFSLAKSTGSSR